MSDLIDRIHLSKFDNQKARQELERRIVYGLAREWEFALGILAPAHHIQADTSLDNIKAMYESALA